MESSSNPGSSNLGVMSAYFTSRESGKAAAVSATNLFTAPGSAVQQVWIITGTINAHLSLAVRLRDWQSCHDDCMDRREGREDGDCGALTKSVTI
jgi:hypothetical protein